MQKYLNNVQDSFGNAIGSVTVTVRDNPGGGLATLFSDNAGTPKANPFTNDPDGEFFFYSIDGRYDIELTGPVTETKSDIRLLDILTTGTTLRINADINTATPPTTEAVSGTFDIYDLANNDRLARFGFASSPILFITNYMQGGALRLQGRDVGGTFRILFEGDPDGDLSLYRAGLKRFSVLSSGIAAIFADGNTDTETRYLSFRYANSTTRGLVGHNGSDVLTLRNQVHGGNISLVAENVSGTVKNILIGDPDGQTTIYNAGVKRLGTNFTGIVEIFGNASTDTENRLLYFNHQDGTVRGWLGHAADANLWLRNAVHGGLITVTAEDSGGVERTIISADPDGQTIVRGDTNIILQAAVGESVLAGLANGSVLIYYNNVEELKTADHTAAGKIAGAEVKDAGGAYRSVGLGVSVEIALSGTGTQTYFSQGRCGGTIYWTGGSATNMDTYASTGASQTNIPGGSWWVVQNNGAGALTIRGGTSVTMRYWSGAGAAPADVDVVIPRGSNVLIRKVSNTVYDVSHN